MSLKRLTRESRKRAIKSYRDGLAHRWIVCAIASRVVGSYDPGETAGLARKFNLSIESIYNFARAGVCYRHLRQFAADVDKGIVSSATLKEGHAVRKIQALRRSLPYSFFAVSGRLMKQYDIPANAIVYVLDDAMRTGASVSDVSTVLTAEWGNKPSVPGLEGIDSSQWQPIGKDVAELKEHLKRSRYHGVVLSVSNGNQNKTLVATIQLPPGADVIAGDEVTLSLPRG